MLFEAPLKIYWRILIVLLWWISAASQRHPFLGEIWVKVELLSLNLPSLQIFLPELLSNITFLGLQFTKSTLQDILSLSSRALGYLAIVESCYRHHTQSPAPSQREIWESEEGELFLLLEGEIRCVRSIRTFYQLIILKQYSL